MHRKRTNVSGVERLVLHKLVSLSTPLQLNHLCPNRFQDLREYHVTRRPSFADFFSICPFMQHDTPWPKLADITAIVSKKRLRRRIMYTVDDLLTKFGGAAGIFLGCSLISLLEIFYFILERVCTKCLWNHQLVWRRICERNAFQWAISLAPHCCLFTENHQISCRIVAFKISKLLFCYFLPTLKR